MSKNKKVLKLGKILKFYQQQLGVIQIQYQQQDIAVLEIEKAIRCLDQEHESIHMQADSSLAIVADRQHAIGMLELVQSRINKKKIELGQSQALLLKRKRQLQEQMSRVESFEKLIARKTNLLYHENHRREQSLADSRYLSQNFTGHKK